MWAVYTLAFKRSGLTRDRSRRASWRSGRPSCCCRSARPALVRVVAAGHALDVIVQAGVQGVLSGVLAIVLYGIAITRLGATRGAALTALVPVVAARPVGPAARRMAAARDRASPSWRPPWASLLAAGALDGWRRGRNRGTLPAA